MDEKSLIYHLKYGFWKIQKKEMSIEENYKVMKDFLNQYDPNWFKEIEQLMKEIPPRIIE